MSAAMHEVESHDHMAEVIWAAIGSNDPYPTAVQLAAHRAKQAQREKYFSNEYRTDEAQ
ncbi:hypothetical protein [uncultured Massilia sp.]|uniref:hypothetical protein n=1 Tax=uncultured Massilia sp. TaxID=169973 RepID=UPI0025D64056|nr:hypothetical protein [uncultured Massilia sp.]